MPALPQAKAQLTSGVYSIVHVASGKRYVGSTTAILAYRWTEHRWALRAGRHHNRHLQYAWNKYGPTAFIFEVLERCPTELTLAREEFWISFFCACDPAKGYNLCGARRNSLGVKRTAETRLKMSLSQKGRRLTAEHRARLSEAMRGNANRRRR